MSTYFYTRLTRCNSGYHYSAVRKWTKKLKVMHGLDKIIVTPSPHRHLRARARTGTHTRLCMLRASLGGLIVYSCP